MLPDDARAELALRADVKRTVIAGGGNLGLQQQMPPDVALRLAYAELDGKIAELSDAKREELEAMAAEQLNEIGGGSRPECYPKIRVVFLRPAYLERYQAEIETGESEVMK